MGQDIPKQFINVYDKPVLIYTLEGFQRHPDIDAIFAFNDFSARLHVNERLPLYTNGTQMVSCHLL